MNKLTKVEAILPLRKKMGRPFGWRKTLDRTKLEKVKTALPATVEEAIENLFLFDCRQLDASTARELVRLIPALLHMRHAWRAHFAEYGCLVCHRKKTEYGAGGFCFRCGCRIGGRMRRWLRQIEAGHDRPGELRAFKEALTLKFSTAQRLLNGDD